MCRVLQAGIGRLTARVLPVDNHVASAAARVQRLQMGPSGLDALKKPRMTPAWRRFPSARFRAPSWPACERSFSSCAQAIEKGTIALERIKVRGVPAAISEADGMLELYTGDSTVALFADTKDKLSARNAYRSSMGRASRAVPLSQAADLRFRFRSLGSASTSTPSICDRDHVKYAALRWEDRMALQFS